MKKSTKVFKVSDPSQNVYGMTVRTSGIETQNFIANPTCLLNHDYNIILGLWDDLLIVGSDMTAVPVLDDDDPEALKYYGKVERDLLKGASIGIIPLAVEGNEITRCELLEISLTPVPANRNALVIYSSERVALNVEQAKAYMLSVDTSTPKNPNHKNSMNENLRSALMLLCVQSGLTLVLSADTADDVVIEALQKVGGKIQSLSLSNTQLSAANLQYKTDAEALALSANTAMVDKAIEDKIITADSRQGWLNLAAAQPELAKTTLAGLKPVTLSVIPGAEDATKKVVESADRAAWSFQDWQQKDSVSLSAMQGNDPERFQKLFSAFQMDLKAKGAIA